MLYKVLDCNTNEEVSIYDVKTIDDEIHFLVYGKEFDHEKFNCWRYVSAWRFEPIVEK